MKITGNYLLIVYRDDKSDLILSKRMMVYDSQIGLSKDDQMIGAGTLNRASQQFNFRVGLWRYAGNQPDRKHSCEHATEPAMGQCQTQYTTKFCARCRQ